MYSAGRATQWRGPDRASAWKSLSRNETAFSLQPSFGRVVQKRDMTSVAMETKHRILPDVHQFNFRANFSARSGDEQQDNGALLCKAASLGNLEEVRKLVSSGVDPNTKDYDKRTALHLAAAEGKVDVLFFLIERGAELNSRDRFGRVPLDDAVVGNHREAIDLLKKHGAKPGLSLPIEGQGLQRRLIDACSKGDLDLVKQCMKSGAEVNLGDYDARTPLHLAAAEGRVDVVAYLLSLGANVNSIDRFGNTPLQDALRTRNPSNEEVSKMLEAHGAILNKEIWRIRTTPEFQSTVQKSLPLLCERGNWEYAEVWVPNTEETKLISSDAWYSDRSRANKFTHFRQDLDKIGFSSKDQNPYSKVWGTKTPLWVPDVAQESLPHLRMEGETSLHSGVVIPITYNDKVLAVLGFYASEKKPASQTSIEQFHEFSSGLIKAGISQAVSRANISRDKQTAPTTGEQMNAVYNYIVDEGVFNGTLIYQELDWYYNHLGLQQYYFERFAPSTIAKHLHSFIAAKKLAQATGQPEDVRVTMQQKDASSAFYLCPADHESLVHVESKVEQMIANSLPLGKAYTLTFFRSKGTSVPNGTMHLGLYIYDTADYIEKDPDPNETSIWKLATGVFLRDKTAMIRERYQEVIKKTAGKLSPLLEVFPEYRDGTIPVMFAFKMGANTSYMSQITELIKHNGLTVERKFIETFANGLVIYSLYLHPCDKKALNDMLDQVSLLHSVPRSPLTELFVHSKCSAAEYAYGSAASRCIYYFLSKPSEEFNMLAKVFKDDPINMGRLALLQTTLRRDAISQERIINCLISYPHVWRKLFQDFEKVVSSPTRPDPSTDIATFIKKEVADEMDEAILLAFNSFNQNILKTNFYKRKKSCLAFRLDPMFMADSGYTTRPYGVFFIMSTEFQGFHVRFRDVARGGIRIISSANEENYNRNLETQFDETYNLAFTQNKKNKDIPEFGSKGTILLNWNPSSQKNKFLAFQKYIAGLLDLIIPPSEQSPAQRQLVDHYGKPELLFLGPDEGTADYMQWAAEYAARRKYPFALALTTGKPIFMGGVPHDKFGMTTRSVHRYVTGCLDKAGLKEEEVTKLQTGGPDGDLGSNEILMSKDKTIGVVDGSGVVFDPAGINREELCRLAKARKMIIDFDLTKLGPGGFRVLVTDKDVTLPNGDFVPSGFTFRNEFHLNPIASADLFVPCGGRPESVNLKNVQKMFHKDGTPRFKFIIEGANLFLTPDARMVLEQHGVIVFRDASTNKGGVTSSSMEVLAALALSVEEHTMHMQVKDPSNPPKFYQQYVEEIKQRIEENAALEFECIWKEHEITKTPRYLLTDKLSDKINSFNDAVQESSLWENEKFRHAVMRKALPQTLINLLGLETALKRVPENYAKAIFGSYIASRYVYKFGLSASEFSFYEFVQEFLH